MTNDLEGIETVIFDLDGTLYDKTGLAKRVVKKLWWCLPLLAAERLARRNAHYVQFASEEGSSGLSSRRWLVVIGGDPGSQHNGIIGSICRR